MRKLCLLPAFLVWLSVGVFGQSEQSTPQDPRQANAPAVSPCPQIELRSQGPKAIREGQPISFTANIAGGDKNVTPAIVWNVSGGAIKDGQGTRRIDVDSNGAGADRKIVADLWVGGYAPECITQANTSVNVVPPAHKIDEFGELAPDEEKSRMEAAAAAVASNSDHLYLIGYAGRQTVRMYTSTALRRMRDQIMKAGLPPSRVSAYDGGFREQPAFELWIVPEGAEPPRPTPTVDRKEIVYPKTPPRSAPARKP